MTEVKGVSKHPILKRGELASDRIFDAINMALMVIVGIVIIYPLYYVLVASFTEPSIVSSGKMLFYPEKLFLDGYRRIFEYKPIWQGYMNTILYTVTGVAICITVTIPAAYALSRDDLFGQHFWNLVFTFTMFFGGGIIPMFVLLRTLKIYDTIWAITLPSAVSVFNLIVCRTFFLTNIPRELHDAAVVDGCTDFRYFFQVVIPLSKTIIAVMILFYGTRFWNDYMNALMYLADDEKMPLQIILRKLILVNTVGSAVYTDPEELAVRAKLAAQLKFGIIVVSAAPLMVVYPFLQKYFAVGMTVGAVKG